MWLVSGMSVPPDSTRLARLEIHGSSSSASRARTMAGSRRPGVSSSSRRMSAWGSSRSPVESSASIACARTSGSSDTMQRRMIPPASVTPRTTSASRLRAIERRSPCHRTSLRKSVTGPGAGPVSIASVRRACRRSVARSSRARVQSMTGRSDLGTVATEGPEGGRLGPSGSGREQVQEPGRCLRPLRQGRRRRRAHDGGVIVERRQQGGVRPVRVGRDGQRPDRRDPNRRRRIAGDSPRPRSTGTGSPSRPDRAQTGDPLGRARAAHEVVDDRGRARIRPIRTEQARDGGPDLRVRIDDQLVDQRQRLERRRRVGGQGTDRPDRRRAHARIGVGQARLAAAIAGGGPPSRPRASSAAARTVGIGVVVDGPDEHRPGSLDRRPAEKVGRHPSHARLIRPKGADQGVRRGGVPGQGAQTRAALEDLLAEARRAGCRGRSPRSAAGSPATTSVHSSAVRAPSQKTWSRAKSEPAASRSKPGQDRPDLARDAVVEGQDLGATLARDDVVERAPGGIRDAALGDLLGEPEDRRGRRSRTRRATARSRPGTRSAGAGRPPRPRTARRRRLASTSETTNEVAVVAADSRPRTVARSASERNVSEAARRNG